MNTFLLIFSFFNQITTANAGEYAKVKTPKITCQYPIVKFDDVTEEVNIARIAE